MRIKSLFIYCLVVTISLLSSCGKDDEAPEQQIDLDGNIFSLNGANLYLIDQYTTTEGREFLTYAISDGTYTNYSGCGGLCLDDYDNETFFFHIKLGSAVNGKLIPGKFRMRSDLAVPPTDETMCFIRMDYLETISPEYFSIRSNGNEPSPLIINGGLEDEQKMTIKFNGNLKIGELPVRSSIYYSGTVIDAR